MGWLGLGWGALVRFCRGCDLLFFGLGIPGLLEADSTFWIGLVGELLAEMEG
jgi:hypothetical protein